MSGIIPGAFDPHGIVETAFKEFVAMVYPGSDEEIINRMRVLFFSGAWWTINALSAGLSEGEAETIHQELKAYCTMIAGSVTPKAEKH